MKKLHKLAVTLASVMIVAIAVVTQGGASQQTPDLSPNFPSGQWSVSAQPYMGADVYSRPIFVRSVTSEKKTLAVTKVGIVNQTLDSVTAVRLRWYLTSASGQNLILQQGETNILKLDEPLPTKGKQTIEHPIVSFPSISRPLLKGNTLLGDYLIHVEVSQAYFQDKSIWKGEHKNTAEHLAMWKVAHATKVEFLKASAGNPALRLQFCPQQTCTYHEGGPGGSGYSCSSTDSKQYCTNNVNSCTNTMCSA